MLPFLGLDRLDLIITKQARLRNAEEELPDAGIVQRDLFKDGIQGTPSRVEFRQVHTQLEIVPGKRKVESFSPYYSVYFRQVPIEFSSVKKLNRDRQCPGFGSH